MTPAGRCRLLVSVLLVITACSGSAGTVPTTPDDAGNPGPAESTSPSPPTTAAVSKTSTTTRPTTLVPRVDFDLDQIDTTTPASGGGARPELAWEAVDGAEQYRVTVFAPNGGPYWATQTVTPRVHVGGEPQLNEEAAGPSISPGMSWRVVAVGSDRRPLAVSERVPISP